MARGSQYIFKLADLRANHIKVRIEGVQPWCNRKVNMIRNGKELLTLVPFAGKEQKAQEKEIPMVM